MTKQKKSQSAEVEAQPVRNASRSDAGGRTHCEVWTRVMGYHRPVSHFNIGKKAEHYSRKHFQETVAANHEFCEKYQLQPQAC
ncbi:MAG: anaerobic ribonucleoside-triphosphate reductase [bacterium]|nr:anaerobic ribonucleoside-triphosphate reductase [bacterium]